MKKKPVEKPAVHYIDNFQNTTQHENIQELYAKQKQEWRGEQESVRSDPDAEDRSYSNVDLIKYHNTDLGNSERLVALHCDNMLYCHQFRSWFIWNQSYWRRDESLRALSLAKDTIRNLQRSAISLEHKDKAPIMKWALGSESEKRINAMLNLARSELPVSFHEFDRDPWLFNVENGTLDLKNGSLLQHQKANLITKIAPVVYDDEARCDRWLNFLDRIMDGNEELIGFLQLATGYSLTGNVSEQMLFFLYGTGANGKSTFINVLIEIFGDYGRQTEPELLIQRRDAHLTGIADLLGVRLAVSSEIEEGKRLAEVTVKQLTGGDRISARRMRQDLFNFKPTHKLWLCANHKPVVRGTDHAIWRRIKLIPFEVTIPQKEQDPELKNKLLEEKSGILTWMVEGCLQWQRSGLKTPNKVLSAMSSYQEEMDIIGDFIAESCNISPVANVAVSDLYVAYVKWCECNKEHQLGKRSFNKRVEEHGFSKMRGSGNKLLWKGVELT